MKKKLVHKSVSVIGLLATCFSTSAAFAEWSNDSAHNGYNPGYGNFPPEDIEQRLFGHMDSTTEQYQAGMQSPSYNKQWRTPPVNRYTAPAPWSNPSQPTNSQPSYPVGNAYQQPYQPQQYKTSPFSAYPPALQENNRSMDFNNPWNNSQSNFSMPWGNNSSNGNMMPWGNNSHNNTSNKNPWDSTGDNNSTNFTSPWESKGSNFSMPWGGNNSSFSPWGN